MVFDEKAIIKMAKDYTCDKNPLFLSVLDTYMVQKCAINKIKEVLADNDELIIEKEYVKGRPNLCLNPAVKELPRHADSLTKTTAQLLNIIKALGHGTESKSDFDSFIEQ